MTKIKKVPKPEEVQATIKKLVQQTLKEALETELEKFLGYSKYKRSNSRNSLNAYTPKTVKTASGPLEINVTEIAKVSSNQNSSENTRPCSMS